MAYTEAEQSELFDAWANSVALEHSEWAEQFVKGIITGQTELGLVASQGPVSSIKSPSREPNLGRVKVQDERVEQLGKLLAAQTEGRQK